MSYLITSADGDLVAQHHNSGGGTQSGQGYGPNVRLPVRMVRVMGRDQANPAKMLICDGKTVPDQPSSLGPIHGGAVWYASNQPDPSGVVRQVPLWSQAFPALVEPPGTGGTQAKNGDPYKSKVQGSTLATPAFDQDPKDALSWRRDTGLLAQKVAMSGIDSLPGDYPVVALPLSITTEQQMAAVPATNALIAVWNGGAKNGRFGSLVYDVTPAGSLDKSRRARVHSAWAVYQLPTAGLIPFGGVPPSTATPFPLSGGLAWQLGLDVDSQAGYGVVQDVGIADPTPTEKSGNTPKGDWNGPDPSKPDGTGTGGTQEASSGAPGTQGGGSGGLGYGVTGRQGYGPLSVGSGAGDPHNLATTPDGLPVNSTHWNVLAPIDGDGFDAPAETAGYYKRTSRAGPLFLPVFWRYDPGSTHQFVGGSQRQGLRRWQVGIPFDVPPPTRRKNPPKDGGIKDPLNDPSRKPGSHDDDAAKIPNDQNLVDGPVTGGTSDGLIDGPVAGTSDGSTTGGLVDGPTDGSGSGLGGGTTTGGSGVGPTGGHAGGSSTGGLVDGPTDGSGSGLGGGTTIGGGYFDPKAIHDRAIGNPGTGGPSTTDGPNGLDPGAVHKRIVNGNKAGPKTLWEDGYGGPGSGPNRPLVNEENEAWIRWRDRVIGSGVLQTPPEISVGPVLGSQTLGASILSSAAAIQVAGSGSITQDRPYVRTPLELAGPGLLGRPQRLLGPDLRGRVAALTETQLAAYNAPTPISAGLSAVASQVGGSFQFLAASGPGTALYAGGATKAGGFALHPASVDVQTVVQNTPAQNIALGTSGLGETTLFMATFASQTGWADPHPNGGPRDGYTQGRGTNTSTSLDWIDSAGVTGGSVLLPSAIYFDSGQSVVDPPPACQIWGGQVVTVWNNTNGQAAAGTVFVADGTNTAPGGTWQLPSSASGLLFIYSGGSDGAIDLDGVNTYSPLLSKSGNVYTAIKDLHCTTIRVRSGCTLKPGGASFRIQATGALAVDAGGTISANGNAGGNGVFSGIPSAGTGYSTGSWNTGSGAGGAANQNSSQNGTSTTNSVLYGFGSAGSGGNGQLPVGTPFTTGGAGGAANSAPANYGSWNPISFSWASPSIGGQVWASCAPGGGSGGGGGTYSGGAGGGGAGGLWIAAGGGITNNGTISATGGNGGNGGVPLSGTTGEGTGGGGGGMGGAVIVFTPTGTVTGNAPTAAGGAHGLGESFAGPQASLNGTDGASGWVSINAA